MNHPIATVELKEGGRLVLELYPEIAPNTVSNFVDLANSGQYDGLTIHRIVKDFMIQSGSFSGDCHQKSTFSIPGEFSENGFKNDLKHETGVISMARGNPFDSASTQWFIMHRPAARLDGKYAAFGRLIEGFDLLEELGNRPTVMTPGKDNAPLTPIYLSTVRVDLNGCDIPAPQRQIPAVPCE